MWLGAGKRRRLRCEAGFVSIDGSRWHGAFWEFCFSQSDGQAYTLRRDERDEDDARWIVLYMCICMGVGMGMGIMSISISISIGIGISIDGMGSNGNELAGLVWILLRPTSWPPAATSTRQLVSKTCRWLRDCPFAVPSCC